MVPVRKKEDLVDIMSALEEVTGEKFEISIDLEDKEKREQEVKVEPKKKEVKVKQSKKSKRKKPTRKAKLANNLVGKESGNNSSLPQEDFGEDGVELVAALDSPTLEHEAPQRLRGKKPKKKWGLF